MSEQCSIATLKFEEAIEVSSIEQIHEKFVRAIQDHDQIKVDLLGVDSIDASATQLFLAAKRDAEASGKSIAFEVSDAVAEKLRSCDAWGRLHVSREPE